MHVQIERQELRDGTVVAGAASDSMLPASSAPRHHLQLTSWFCGVVSRTQMYLPLSQVTFVKVMELCCTPRLWSCRQGGFVGQSIVKNTIARMQASRLVAVAAQGSKGQRWHWRQPAGRQRAHAGGGSNPLSLLLPPRLSSGIPANTVAAGYHAGDSQPEAAAQPHDGSPPAPYVEQLRELDGRDPCGCHLAAAQLVRSSNVRKKRAVPPPAWCGEPAFPQHNLESDGDVMIAQEWLESHRVSLARAESSQRSIAACR